MCSSFLLNGQWLIHSSDTVLGRIDKLEVSQWSAFMAQQNPNQWNPQGPPPAGTTPDAQGAWNAGQAPQWQQGPAPDATLTKLNSDSQMWMIVAIAGFFFGFGWISGPLCWYMGNKLKQQYQAIGQAPSSSAELTYWGGIITTALMVLAIVGTILAVLFGFGLFATMLGAAAVAG
jgi:hypothetical protein